MPRHCITICLLGLGAAGPSLADSVLEFQTTEFTEGQAVVGTVQISTSGSDTRLEIISVSSAEAGGLIFDSEQREMIFLDHAHGSYLVIGQEQMNAMASRAGRAGTQPPWQSQPVKVNDLRSRGEVAGIPCRIYEVVRGGRKIRELCVSKWEDLAGGHETADALKSVMDFFEEMRRAAAGTQGIDVFDRQRELLGYMSELDGYPILNRDFSASGALERQTLLTAVREEQLNPEYFEPPKNYQPQVLPPDAN